MILLLDIMIAATTPPASLPNVQPDPPLASDSARVGNGHATVIAYDVSNSGTVTHCSVYQFSGAPELDDRACQIFLEKAHFTPKRDSRGRAIPDFGRKTRIVWNMEP